jgi:hypothetical protein
MMNPQGGGNELKRNAIRSLSILLVLGLLFTGCTRDTDNSSGTGSGQTSKASGSATSLSAGGSSTTSSHTSEYDALLSELDDLEKALNGLDQVSSGDVEIPTP